MKEVNTLLENFREVETHFKQITETTCAANTYETLPLGKMIQVIKGNTYIQASIHAKY